MKAKLMALALMSMFTVGSAMADSKPEEPAKDNVVCTGCTVVNGKVTHCNKCVIEKP